MLSTLAPRVRLWAGIATLVIAGCGGGGEAATQAGGGDAQPTAGQQDDTGSGGGGGGGGTVGAATLTADPGTAWAEVDGDRLEYTAAGGVNYECSVTENRVTINFQTADGHDLLIQGADQGDGWFLDLTFKPGGGTEISYGANSMEGGGTFGMSDGTVSYEGQVSRVEDFDLANATKVDARVAANCAASGGGSGNAGSGGGDPTATIGGQAYAFALSGAQSVACDVAPEQVEIRINRLAIDNTQLEINGRHDGERWVGAVVVYTADGQYVSPLPVDGTGLAIDGSSVEYAGTFTAPDGGELEGTASATCP